MHLLHWQSATGRSTTRWTNHCNKDQLHFFLAFLAVYCGGNEKNKSKTTQKWHKYLNLRLIFFKSHFPIPNPSLIFLAFFWGQSHSMLTMSVYLFFFHAKRIIFFFRSKNEKNRKCNYLSDNLCIQSKQTMQNAWKIIRFFFSFGS